MKNTPVITPAQSAKFDSLISGYIADQAKDKIKKANIKRLISELSANDKADFEYYLREIADFPKWIKKTLYYISLSL